MVTPGVGDDNESRLMTKLDGTCSLSKVLFNDSTAQMKSAQDAMLSPEQIKKQKVLDLTTAAKERVGATVARDMNKRNDYVVDFKTETDSQLNQIQALNNIPQPDGRAHTYLKTATLQPSSSVGIPSIIKNNANLSV